MAHIMAFAATPEVIDGSLRVKGFSYVSDMTNAEEIYWIANVSWTATQAAINAAIIAAAIAAAEAAGHTIGPLDNRMVVAGAVGI